MTRLEGFDRYIQDAMTSWHCPGVAISIVRGDEVLHRAAYGLRDVEAQLPMTEDTRFAMASVTKSFTAMSVALLVDQGKLEWDKPVREVIPEFILNDPYATAHVTVRDMLSHRTGLPRHDFAAWRLDLPRAEFVKRLRHLKLSTSLREKFQYNNLMYYMAAHLVERVAGQRWEDFMQEHVFAPLGMVASNFVPEPPHTGQVNANGYRVDRDEEGGAKGLIPMPFGAHTELSPGAAGALFSTLSDLTRWLTVHVNDGRLGDLQFISPDNLKQMHLPQMIIPGGGFNEALMGNTIFAYGMGWFIEPYRSYTLIHHGGNVEGHSLIVGFVPQERVGLVALTNIAAVPLRDVLLYEGLDRALDLSDRGWNAKFHAMIDPLIAGEEKARQTSADERVEGAPPTHPLDAYVGTFHTEGYPDFAVRVAGEGLAAPDAPATGDPDTGEATLEACLVGSLDWNPVRHYHYDVFEWDLSVFHEQIKLRFLTNDNGDVDAISIPIEPAVDDVTFSRKEPELTTAIVEALVGSYQTPVEGLAFRVTAREGKLYAAQTGAPPREIKPYKLTSALVGFRLDRVRLDFTREGDAITGLVIKMPSTTLEARRAP